MPSGGHNKKPAAIHMLHGSFDKRRQPRQKVPPTAPPRRPRGLDRVATAHWDFILKHRAAWVSESDAPALATMCRAWSMLQKATKAFSEDPLDASKRLAYATLSKEWTAGAVRFGMTPVDRERLGDATADASRSALEAKYLA